MSHPAIEPDRVKKSKSRFEAERKIPSESEGKSSDFARYGMVVWNSHSRASNQKSAEQTQQTHFRCIHEFPPLAIGR